MKAVLNSLPRCLFGLNSDRIPQSRGKCATLCTTFGAPWPVSGIEERRWQGSTSALAILAGDDHRPVDLTENRTECSTVAVPYCHRPDVSLFVHSTSDAENRAINLSQIISSVKVSVDARSCARFARVSTQSEDSTKSEGSRESCSTWPQKRIKTNKSSILRLEFSSKWILRR